MSGEPVSILRLLKAGRERLAAAPCHDENYVNEALYLLQAVIDITREQLVIRGGEVVSPPLVREYSELISRRIAGEPLQYIIGEWEFYGLTMKVGAGVLIPRPETEELVELVLKFIKPIKSPALLDLCSGSGCIPIAIAKSRPDAHVFGVELSEAAY
ncbi:MAG: HemK/PrmC family methyltransferase, partial [Angelakisella sp.]